MFQVVNHVIRLPPYANAGAKHADHLSVTDNDGGPLPRTDQASSTAFSTSGAIGTPCSRTSRRLPTRTVVDSAACLDRSFARMPAPGWNLNSSTFKSSRSRRRPRPPAFAPGDVRWPVRPTRPDAPEISRRLRVGFSVGDLDHVTIAKFGLSFGERSRLVEGEGIDPRDGLDGRASLHEHAAASQPCRRREDRGRRRQHESTRGTPRRARPRRA